MVEYFSSKQELPEDISLMMIKECLINFRQLETFLNVILVRKYMEIIIGSLVECLCCGNEEN